MKKNLKTFLIYVVIPVIIVLILIQFIRPIRISGESMMPTFKNGELCFMYKSNKYTRGDIIVFKTKIVREEIELKRGNFLQQWLDGKNKILIKRIVGLPGDKITILKGNIFINDIFYEEYENKTYEVEVYVESDSYYVLGDNRNKSIDSRNKEVGNISKDEILGKVIK